MLKKITPQSIKNLILGATGVTLITAITAGGIYYY